MLRKKRTMKINLDFFVTLDSFLGYSYKATDWFIKSLRLNGIDREIARLYEKKNNKIAIKHLRKLKKWMN